MDSMGNSTPPKKDIQLSETDGKAGEFISSTNIANLSDKSANNYEGTADHTGSHRCGNRDGSSVFFDYTERSQQVPKRRPDQEAQESENDKAGQQHTRDRAQNSRQRPKRLPA